MTPWFFKAMGRREIHPRCLSHPGSKWTLVLLVILVLPGCSFKPGTTVRYHVFDYPVSVESAPSAIPGTLMVYRFLLAPSVDPDFIVVTRRSGSQEAATSHRWAQNPAEMITDLIQRDLADAALFERTVGQYSSVRYRYALEGKILNLRGLRENGMPRTLLEGEAILTDFGAPLGVQTSIMAQSYRIEAPCPDTTPEAIVVGLNQAVKEFSSRLLKDIRRALEKSRDLKATTAIALSDPPTPRLNPNHGTIRAGHGIVQHLRRAISGLDAPIRTFSRDWVPLLAWPAVHGRETLRIALLGKPVPRCGTPKT